MLDKLREATRPLHEELETKLFSNKIIDKSISKGEHVQLLRINYLFFTYVERSLENCNELSSFMVERSSDAANDLKALDIKPDDIDESNDFFKLLQSPDALLGALYVALGSILGAQMIAKKLDDAEQIPKNAISFYANGAQYVPLWKELKSYLEANADSYTDDKVVEGAVTAFKYFATLFEITKEERKKILVVDDNDEYLEMLHYLLKKHYDLKTISSYEEYEQMNELIPADLLILDYHIGMHTAADIINLNEDRDQYQGIPVLLVSGSSMDTEKNAKQINSTSHIEKPFSKTKLLGTIENIFNQE